MLSFTPVSYLGAYHRPPSSPQDRYVSTLAALQRQSGDVLYQQALLDTLYPPSPYHQSDVLHPLSPLDLSFTYEEHVQEQRRAMAIRRQQEDAERRRIALFRRQKEEYERLVSLRQEVAYHRKLLLYRQKVEQERLVSFRQQQEAERLRVASIQQQAQQQHDIVEQFMGVRQHWQRLNRERREEDGVRQVLDPFYVRQVVEEPMHYHAPLKSTKTPQSIERNLRENIERLSNILLDVIAGSTEAAQSKAEVSKSSASEVKVDSAASQTLPPIQVKSPEPSVREQLESRYFNEYEVEIRDVIKALLASLTTSTGASAAVKKDDEQVPESSKSKGKGKAVSFELPPTIGTSKDVVDSLDTIRNINTSSVLESDFVFPARLDFEHAAVHMSSPSESDSSTSSKLAYTSNNAPLRYYENALSALLTQLDAVESFGSEDVRIKRKEVVERVEKALEDIEREVEQRLAIWVRKAERESTKLQEPSEKDRATEVAVVAPGVTQDQQPTSPAEVIPAAAEIKSDNVESLAPAADDSVPAALDLQVEHPADEELPASDAIPSHSDNVEITGEPASVSSEALQPPAEVVSPTPSSTSVLEPEPVDTFLLPASPVLQPQSSPLHTRILMPSSLMKKQHIPTARLGQKLKHRSLILN